MNKNPNPAMKPRPQAFIIEPSSAALIAPFRVSPTDKGHNQLHVPNGEAISGSRALLSCYTIAGHATRWRCRLAWRRLRLVQQADPIP